MRILPEQLQKELETLNIPVYNTIIPDEDAQPPYLIYAESAPLHFAADNIIFYTEPNYVVELYDNIKNYKKEKEIEKLFNKLEIEYQKSPDMYDEDEQLTVISYEI